MKTIEVCADSWVLFEEVDCWPAVMFSRFNGRCTLEPSQRCSYISDKFAEFMCREYLRFLESYEAVAYKGIVNAPEVL